MLINTKPIFQSLYFKEKDFKEKGLSYKFTSIIAAAPPLAKQLRIGPQGSSTPILSHTRTSNFFLFYSLALFTLTIVVSYLHA